MGRYTTVQTFADNNPSIAKVSYDEAALASSKVADQDSKGESFGTGVTVERVNNVMGSTAGAGSGEFHMYRHTRRREMDRMEGMERREAEEEAQTAFEQLREAKRKECEERTRKNAEKRRRKKMRKLQHANSDGQEKKAAAEKEPIDESKFSYTPLHLDTSADTSSSQSAKREVEVLKAVVANDGSFLEKAKAMKAADTSSTGKGGTSVDASTKDT